MFLGGECDSLASTEPRENTRRNGCVIVVFCAPSRLQRSRVKTRGGMLVAGEIFFVLLALQRSRVKTRGGMEDAEFRAALAGYASTEPRENTRRNLH